MDLFWPLFSWELGLDKSIRLLENKNVYFGATPMTDSKDVNTRQPLVPSSLSSMYVVNGSHLFGGFTSPIFPEQKIFSYEK